MSIKDFSKINLKYPEDREDCKERENLEGIFSLASSVPGFPPYLRGSKNTMYVTQPWKTELKADFNSLEEYNYFLKREIDRGQKDFFVKFSLHNIDLTGGKNNAILIKNLTDMEIVFKQIPLDKIALSFSAEGMELPILILYIAMANKRGIPLEELKISIEVNLSKESDDRWFVGAFLDIIDYTNKRLPKFSFEFSHLFSKEQDNVDFVEWVKPLKKAIEYLEIAREKGWELDDVVKKISFSFGEGDDFYHQITKMRVARIVWAKLISRLGPREEKSMALVSKIRKEKESSVVDELAVILSGVDTISISSEREMEIQQIILEETGVSDTIDPMGGSFLVEKLTEEILESVWRECQEIKSIKVSEIVHKADFHTYIDLAKEGFSVGEIMKKMKKEYSVQYK